jgi:hypothetical protein
MAVPGQEPILPREPVAAAAEPPGGRDPGPVDHFPRVADFG